jgi:hypothetical protein
MAGAARASRHQPGRRDKDVRAFIEALQWNLASADAWAELLDYAPGGPGHPDTGGPVRGPFGVRPRLLRQLLTVPRGRDRLAGSARRRVSACEPNC